MLFYLFSIIININIVATLLHHTMQISYIFRSTIFFFAPARYEKYFENKLKLHENFYIYKHIIIFCQYNLVFILYFSPS